MFTRRRLTATAAVVVLSVAFAAFGPLAAPSQVDAAVKPCFGRNPTIVGTNGADELIGTSGIDVIAGLSGDDVILGGGGNDYICGNAGDDNMDGEGGRDSLNGGADDDIVFGSGSADIVAGGSGFDILLGGTGNDTVNGGGGFDYAGFLFSQFPVFVDLREEFASGEGSDGIFYVEGVIGSVGDDTMFGNRYQNGFYGMEGEDTFDGRAEADTILYDLSLDPVPRGAVVVDLALGTTKAQDGDDSFVSIEDAVGSPRGDTLRGDAGPNYLDGYLGGDTIDGRDGEDTCLGEIVSNCEGSVTGDAATLDVPGRSLQLLTDRRGD